MRQLFVPSSILLALALGGCGGSNGGAALPQHGTTVNSATRVLRTPLGATSIVPATASGSNTSLCAKPADGSHAGCFATLRTDSLITSAFPDSVNGLTPSDLSSLYNYPGPAAQGTAGSAQTVAVVVVGDYALAESDLGVYRSHFGLPACTTANGCFSKINNTAATGASAVGNATSISAHPTTTNAIGWAAETDADTEMISAVCPHCKIMISEAPTNAIADLSQAVAKASNTGATVVNASFGVPESAADTAYSSSYANIKKSKVVAAAGDWGYGVYYPASDPNVIAVGGTSLAFYGLGVSETAWSSTGSGCSAYFSTPSWQRIPLFGCNRRNVADIAAVADPATGVAAYDSSLLGATGGWAIFGGTSVAAPIISGMYALSGDTARNTGAQTLYGAAAQTLLPVTLGSNGVCFPLYLCTALWGYNGPTGLGVPNGLGSF
jgi:subtilase family serine protease